MYKNLSKEHAKLANLGNFFLLAFYFLVYLFDCLFNCVFVYLSTIKSPSLVFFWLNRSAYFKANLINSIYLFLLIFSFYLTIHLSILPEIKLVCQRLYFCLVFPPICLSIYLARAWETKVGLLEGELKDARDSADLLEFR